MRCAISFAGTFRPRKWATLLSEGTHTLRVHSITALGRYDCLFISPHADDILLSCTGRMLWERDRGQRVLAVVVFAATTTNANDLAALDRLGIDELRLDMP